jgi:hypothetical protein
MAGYTADYCFWHPKSSNSDIEGQSEHKGGMSGTADYFSASFSDRTPRLVRSQDSGFFQ